MVLFTGVNVRGTQLVTDVQGKKGKNAELANRGRLKIVNKEILPWGQAIITLVRSLVTPQLLKEKLIVMLDSAWKTISKSQTDGELASLFKSCWIEIFKNDRATRDNVALMIEIGGGIAIKTFHSGGLDAGWIQNEYLWTWCTE